MNYFFSADTFLMIIRLAIPLILVSLSSTLSELSGIISLGTEGLMLMGAFGAVVGTYFYRKSYIRDYFWNDFLLQYLLCYLLFYVLNLRQIKLFAE